MKEEEFKSFVTKTSDLLGDLEEEQKRDGSEKMKSLQDHWMKLKFQLENRVDLSKMYVAFHSKAVEVTSKYDLIEDELKKRATVGDDDTQNIHANCRIAEDMFVELSHTGNNFIEDSQKVILFIFIYLFIITVPGIAEKQCLESNHSWYDDWKYF